MRELFVATSLMSVAMSIIVCLADNYHFWWIGLVAFLWLCGVNWIFSVIRHGAVASELADGIDELICGKPPRYENDADKEKLKSWF